MTATARTAAVAPSRPLAVLFCLALGGVLVALGVLAAALAGPVGLLGYVAVAGVVVGVGVAKGRALTRPAPEPARTCSCCTTSHTDPVQVV